MNLRDQVITQVITGVLAIILLGGTMALLIVGRSVPEFVVGFDGVIVTAAFANGAFFVQASRSIPVAQALATSMTMHHELAMSGAQTAKAGLTGMIEHASGGNAATS